MQMWKTPTRGKFTEEELHQEVRKFINESVDSKYTILIGTDSQCFGDCTKFITAIVVHRQGKGAQYYYRETRTARIHSLKQRIFQEAVETYKYREWVHDNLDDLIIELDIKVEPHVDIGYNGETKKLVTEIIAMFRGNEPAVIKPYSVAASCVADKHTK